MKTRIKNVLIVLVLFLTLNALFSAAFAQGTAFTYQGHLNTGNASANGSYDLQFSLYAINAGGVAIAGPVTNSATAVSNGLFTTTIDFGPNVFTGGSNWLDIAVQTNGTGTFTELTPRQQIAPTPYAIFAATASNVSGMISSSQLPAAVVTNNETGVGLSGTFSGNGANLTSLNPASLSAGTAGINISGSAATAATAATATLASNVVSGISITNAFITNSIFGGDGSGLTNLNASNLSSGTIPLAIENPAVVTNNQTGVTLNNLMVSGALTLPVITATSSNIIYSGSTPLLYADNNQNFFSGQGAGNVKTSGSDNAAIGALALKANTSGIFNAANGASALQSNTMGSYNTASGGGALYENVSGYYNTAGGNGALSENTIGGFNTANGASALAFNTNGSYNIALGYEAGYNIIGSSNIDIGNEGLATDTNIIRIGSGQTNTIIMGVINGNGGGLTNLNATQLSSGTIPLAQLPNVVVTNNATGLILSGTFTGNGGGLTNLNASQLTSIGVGDNNFFVGPATGNATTMGVDNTAIGVDAFTNNVGGSANTAVGVSALAQNTSGINNMAIGYGALQDNTNGNYNTAAGYAALSKNTTGVINTALGEAALIKNTIGSFNTAIGSVALQGNTTGSNNIALGQNAGNSIITGSSNIDIGNPGVSGDTSIIRIGNGQTQTYLAGTITGDGGGLTNLNVSASQLTSIGVGDNNFFVGPATGNATTMGVDNTAIGVDAFTNNVGGSANTAVGVSALAQNTSGINNMAIGYGALQDNTNGNYNTAAGYAALSKNTTGVINTALGEAALIKNTIGSFNTAIGSVALQGNTTGSNNIALGQNAGNSIITGSSNIDIGNPGVSGDTSIIRIGDGQTQTYLAGIVNDLGGVQMGTNGTVMTTVEAGQAIMPSSSTQETNFTIAFPTAFSSSPKIIFSIANDPGFQSVSDIFSASISSNSPAAFSINVYRLNGTSWSQQLRINWQAWQ